MNRTSSARWTALTVIAPITAALFAGTTVWAAANDPREAMAPVAAQQQSVAAEPTQAPSGDPAIDGTATSVGLTVEEQEQLAAIRARIDKVKAQTQKVLQQAEDKASAATKSDAATTSGGGGSTTSSSQAQPAPQPAPQPAVQPAPQPAAQPAPEPAPAPAPQPAPAPAPQPAPPADTTTGAS